MHNFTLLRVVCIPDVLGPNIMHNFGNGGEVGKGYANTFGYGGDGDSGNQVVMVLIVMVLEIGVKLQ